MEPGHHTDPLEEALSQASQRVAQFASLAGAMAQVVLQRRALHQARIAARDDGRATHVLDEQERLLHQQARLSWASADDTRWLADAGLLDTGGAWAAAACYADTDPAAASAMRKCEDRLRTLHPHAMARYDRLRADGISPLDAMRDTAPLFARSPDVRVGDPATIHPELGVSTGRSTDSQEGHSPRTQADHPEPEASLKPEADPGISAEQRGKQIIARIRSGARAAGRSDPGSDELAMILDATTNLPQDVIDKITRQPAAEGHPRSQPRHAPASGGAATAALNVAAATSGPFAPSDADASQATAQHDRSAAQLAAQSFPHSAADAIRAAATTQTRHTAPLSTAPGLGQQPGGQM